MVADKKRNLLQVPCHTLLTKITMCALTKPTRVVDCLRAQNLPRNRQENSALVVTVGVGVQRQLPDRRTWNAADLRSAKFLQVHPCTWCHPYKDRRLALIMIGTIAPSVMSFVLSQVQNKCSSEVKVTLKTSLLASSIHDCWTIWSITSSCRETQSNSEQLENQELRFGVSHRGSNAHV